MTAATCMLSKNGCGGVWSLDTSPPSQPSQLCRIHITLVRSHARQQQYLPNCRQECKRVTIFDKNIPTFNVFKC